MARALTQVARRLDEAGVAWLLAGSAGRALLGFARRPTDLDLETDGAGAHRAAATLGLALGWEDDGRRASWRARGRVAGVAVDLSGDVEVRGPGGRLPADVPAQRAWAVTAGDAAEGVWVAPPEEAVVRTLVEADWRALGRLITDAPGGWGPRVGYLALRLAAASAER